MSAGFVAESAAATTTAARAAERSGGHRSWVDATRRFRVRTRLLGGFVLVALVMIVVGVVGLRSQSSLNDTVQTLKVDGLDATVDLMEADTHLVTGRALGLSHIMATSAQDMQRIEREIAEEDRQAVEHVDKFLAYNLPDQVKTSAQETRAALVAYTDARERLVLAPSRAGNDELAAANATGEMATLFRAAQDGFTRTIELNNADNQRLAEEARATYDSGRTLSTVLLVFGVALALILGVVISWTITRPIARLDGVLARVAGGDLRARVNDPGADEVGHMAESLDTALASTQSTLIEVGEQATQLAASSEELSAVSTQLSATAEETAAQAEEVSAAAQQVSTNVATVATGTEEMSASVGEIAKSAQGASEVASEAVHRAADVSAIVARLGTSSSEIGQVVAVINTIAEQTNLLALNATIEAARAGESGRGFAVVAGEVKDLAQETSRSTSEIRRMVASIQAETASATEAIEAINGVIVQINDAQASIAGAVEEQAATASEMNRNVLEASDGVGAIASTVGGVAQAAQTNTEGAEQANRAATDLSQMASRLQELLGRFRL